MSGEERQQQAAQESSAPEVSYLDAMIAETEKRGVSAERTKDLIGSVVKEAMEGTLVWDKGVMRTVKKAIEAIDARLSKQVAAVMHHDEFQKLEGSWRGLQHLVFNSETGSDSNMYIKVLNLTKKDLYKDLTTAEDHDQSQLFQKIYESEFGTAGGEPFGTLVGDFQFSKHPQDVELLEKVAGVAAAAFCPFLSAADPNLMGMLDFTELPGVRDLKNTFTTAEYTQWRSFRESEDSRFVTLSLPRALARLPYGPNTLTVEEFDYREVDVEDDTLMAGKVDHDAYCWMNAAYVLAGRLTDAYVRSGFCTSIRGVEGGGKVEGLPVHVFKSDDGDIDAKCPTEIAITDRREKELSDVGFLPLCHYKNTDYSVFFGAQTTQKPKKYRGDDAATANAAICARLPYVMATSRFAHYLKIIGRNMIGRLMEAKDVQKELNDWIQTYVLADDNPSEELKSQYPLKEARIEIKEDPANPGAYNAIAHLRPWFQMEELNASVRMVASIPQPKQ